MEAQWYADRTLLRTLLRLHPSWTQQDLADATHRSRGWVKKWVKRLQTATDDDLVLHSRSRARICRPPPLSQLVIDRILDIRDHPPDNLQRTPGPLAIRYYLQRDPLLQDQGVRLPRSTRTIWQILHQYGRILQPSAPAPQQRLERPAPMSAWELDFKDVSSVPASPDGKQQHVVEVLNTVDIGTSVLVNAQVHAQFTAETAIQAIVATFRTAGLPDSVTLDRDPRFVGSAQSHDFPAPLVRLLHCLGLQVLICPPRRPDKKPFVERYNRTYEYECLRIHLPSDLQAVQTVTAAFQQHYNYERPNQALSCRNQPPRLAFPALPLRPGLPQTVDPDRWVDVLDHQRFVRKVSAHGTVSIDRMSHYIDQGWAGKYVTLWIDAPERAFIVEYRDQVVKRLPIKGVVGERLALEVYVEQITQQARTQTLLSTPVGHQLRLPLENT
jgi:Integrase core domain